MPRGIYQRGEFSKRENFIGPTNIVFWKRVNKDGPVHLIHGKCWIWMGSKLRAGYGQFRGTKAHRVAYQLTKGPIPKKLFACHKCDRPECVNPDHIFIGTAKDNMEDKMRKGRQGDSGTKTPPSGSKNVKAKLNEVQVLEIRKIYQSGKLSSSELARSYNVTKSTICCIIRRKTWNHI